MDKLKTTEHEYNIRLWITRIKDCRESGLTVPVWCSRNGFGIKNYYYWMRKIKREAVDAHPQKAVPALPELKEAVLFFSKISFHNDNVTNVCAAVTIHFNDITVDIRDGTSEAIIKNTLSAIRSLC